MIVYITVSVILVIGFLGGIRLMQSPKTARWGNRLGALCMLAAIAFVLVELKLFDDYWVWIFLVLGTGAGILFSQKVTMIQMPQTVALFNGFGGAASALVAGSAMVLVIAENPWFFWLAAAVALSIGALTFSGSLVAAFKLQGWVSQKPVSFKGHKPILILLLAVGILLTLVSIFTYQVAYLYALPLIFLLYGVLMAMPIGGADMPVIISFLNAFSGIAASISGLAVDNMLLVGVGALVGVAGMILTKIMCRAMNRNLFAVLSGFKSEQRVQKQGASTTGRKAQGKLTWPQLLQKAKTVVIVPGYGMALAQAQNQVKELMALLETKGKDVKVAIHPVAGRMPGHMNVLLAEAGIDYGKLYEMDKINAEFAHTDVVLGVGACDVINPAANTAEGTPIYGMPILEAYKAKTIIICNLDDKPGYSGVENTLYEQKNVITLWGNASQTIPRIIEGLRKIN